jgi:hypothetical protein
MRIQRITWQGGVGTAGKRPGAGHTGHRRLNFAHQFGARRVEKVQQGGFETDLCLFMVRRG